MITHQFTNSFLKEAISFAKANRLDEAVVAIEKAYIENSNLRDGFSAIGNVYCDIGRYDIALSLFERDRLIDRLSPVYRHVLAFLLACAGRTSEALSEISRAFAEDTSLHYGFSLINGITGKCLFNAIHYSVINQDNDKTASDYAQNADLCDGYAFIGSIHRAFACYDKALYYYEKDNQLNRLTPASRLILAHLLALFQRTNEAEEEVYRAYEDDHTLYDGFALIGNVYRNTGRYDDALAYYARDNHLNRLSPASRHIYADQLARIGHLKEAEYEVYSGYAENSSLRNGFARIGNILRAKSEFKAALEFYERDWKAGRLTPVHSINFAELLSRAGKMDVAFSEVRIAYEGYLSLCDGFSRCAWQYFWPRKEYAKVVEYCERDLKGGRLSPVYLIKLAHAYAAMGQFEKACETVKRAYQINPTLKDGYARCAWQYFWPQREYQKLLEWMALEECKERLSPVYRLRYAQALSTVGLKEEAEKQVAIAYQEDIESNLQGGFTRIMTSSDIGLQLDINHYLIPIHILGAVEKDYKQNRFSKKASCLALPVLRMNAMIASEIAMAELKYDMDLAAQWNCLENLARSQIKTTQRLTILNFEMKISHAADILVQFREIFLHEQYRFISPTTSPFIIDGGADVGMAIAYFKWLYPESHIVAFEPNPSIFDICQDNINHNEWKNVTLLPYALSDLDGEAHLTIIESMPMASTLTCRNPENLHQNKQALAVVPTRRLSTFIKRDVDFLKLDIEGMESVVFKELKKCLKFIQSGFIEYHYDQGLKSNSLADILSNIEAAGFVYRLVDQPNNALGDIFYSASHRNARNWSFGLFFNRHIDQEMLTDAQGETS